jgi:hypothetical protein
MKNLFVIICIGTFLQPFLFGELPKGLTSSQVIAWESVESFVEELRDGCGKPVDQGIKKMVIALNLLGYTTVQSCEGHINSGLPYPWVALDPEQTKVERLSKLYETKDVLCGEAENIEKELVQVNDEKSLYEIEEIHISLARKRQEIWKIWEEIDNAKKELFSSLWDLIREFYQGDLSVNLTTLILYEGRLIPIGGLYQERFSVEQQKENLIRFRREINKFSEFLIQKFCEN